MLMGLVKENKTVLPEGIRLPEGTVVEFVAIERETLELSKEAKCGFRELIVKEIT